MFLLTVSLIAIIRGNLNKFNQIKEKVRIYSIVNDIITKSPTKITQFIWVVCFQVLDEQLSTQEPSELQAESQEFLPR